MPILKLKNLSKSYGESDQKTDVLKDINLDIEDGEFVAIVGFSGTGKTTLVSLIAGLIEADTGDVLLKGQPVTGAGPDRGIVFQSYSLMPWLSVAGNIRMAVDSVFKTDSKAERAARTRKYIDMVGLTPAADRKPAELSGGMRQRVAVARALAISPEILLLDEPLSALDALTRAKLQDEIERIWEQDKKTVVLITNDVDEALLLADRIIPLKPGTVDNPGATLGPAFKVDIPRTRDRSAMNHNQAFKSLRAEITNYLMGVGAARDVSTDGNVIALPSIEPKRLNMGKAADLPKAYTDAAKGPDLKRYLEFTKTTKIYPTPKGPLTVVDEVDLKMPKGQFITLIGHSGCGKSTLLTMAAGLNEISGGGIILENREISAAGPDKAVVFQAPSLMPWLTAYENVALGVSRVYPHASKAERGDIIAYYLDKVGLGDAMHKPASDLSNGMKQRVGIARAFALSPKLLLLDEPFGMLDSLTRWELQDVLMEVWTRTQVTAICVTHDVDEAILLADRVVMMTNGPRARIGKIVDVDMPRPRSRAALLEHPDYYAYRQEVLDFLEEYEHGAAGKTAVEDPANDDDEDDAAPALVTL